MPQLMAGTIEKLIASDYAYSNKRMKRSKMADALKEYSEANLKIDDKDRVAEAPTLDKIGDDVFGITDDPAFRGVIAGLTAPFGPVQQRLDNGHVLLSARVTKQVTTDGTTSPFVRSVRFLTENPELVREYLLDMREIRLVNETARTTELYNMVVKRMPALEADVTTRKGVLPGKVASELNK